MNKKVKILLILGLVFLVICGTYQMVRASEDVEQGTHTEVVAHEGGHGEHGEHGEAHGHGYSRSQWMDLLYRTINFLLFAFIIVKFAGKPLVNALRQREEKIKVTMDQLEKEKEKARQVYLEYEAKLAQLEKEKEKIIQEFIAMGEREKEKIIEMAKKTAEQIKESAKKAAEQEVKSVKEQLRAEVAEIAAELAEEVIKKNFTPQDQKKIVEEYLTKLS